MYIEPNTTIKLYKNIPCDSEYINTLFFANRNAQNNYFHGTATVVQVLERQSYTRQSRNSIRIQGNISSIFQCNYMAFQNASFMSKWFYCFITDVEYVNNVTVEVTYEIDYIQTFLLDCKLNKCFIKRNHVKDDRIGGNITPENIAIGEYNFSDYKAIDSLYMRDMAIAVNYVDVDGTQHFGGKYDNIYSASKIKVFNDDDIESVNTFIDKYYAKENSILSIYMLPKFSINEDIPVGGLELTYPTFSTTGTNIEETLDDFKLTGEELNGTYKPKNNKLYTYPFNFFQIVTADGKTLNLRYEFFKALTPRIRCCSVITQPVACVIYPDGYKGTRDTPGAFERTQPLFNEQLIVDNFPVCSFANDSWRKYAQSELPLQLFQGLGKIGASYATGVSSSKISGLATTMATGSKVRGMITSGLHQAENDISTQRDLADLGIDILSNMYTASVLTADTTNGSFSHGNINRASGYSMLYGCRVHTNTEMTRQIDEYFDRFGYAINLISEPQINNRPHWTFIQTQGLTATGSCPASAISKICKIFDNGITFWKNASEVGNYGLDNSNTTGE